MNNQQAILKAARRLREASQTGSLCEPIRDLIGEQDLGAAYAIQHQNNNLRLTNGARKIGAKIGLTSKVVQQQLGVNQPDFGLLFHDMEVLNGDSISVQLLHQPKVEAEIAFVLGKDLPYGPFTTLDMLQAIDLALLSIEIVGSRIQNWDIRITDTIADNASASHFVIGHRPLPISELDLIGCQMELEVNGTVTSTGTGAACLGSPVNALLWLARTMAEKGKPLQAGDLILTGALGPMTTVKAGDLVQARIDGLGSASVLFTE